MEFQNDLIAEFNREAARTRRMFEAIPEDVDWHYKPHPKSMILGRLAGHLTDMTGEWAILTLTQDKLDVPADHKWEGYVPSSKADLLAKVDGELPQTQKALAAMTPEKWDAHWKFIYGGQTVVDEPRHQVFREMVVSHMVHHRAQLGVYLRLLDKPIPGIYGPSADGM